jgi:probable rRNA maturation factor
MNRVNFMIEEVPLPVSEKLAKAYIQKVLSFLEKDKWDLSVLFCNDIRMKQLNFQYRKKNETTDVLSFMLGETAHGRYLPGDIVISLEKLEENAMRFKVSSDEEFRRLLVHGILHLCGMDHETNREQEPMLQLQEKILASLAGERII